MNKKIIKKFSVVLVLLLLTTLAAGTVGAQPQHEVRRIWGPDRYQTSAAVSGTFEAADSVVIARGDNEGNFADALAASVLAGVLECPILLTRPDRLPASIEDEIKRLKATTAYVLGGEAAVSREVEETLEGLGLTVVRISGANRYATAAAVATAASNLGSLAGYAFIVNGSATADALVSGAAAYKNKAPVLLVRQDEVHPSTHAALVDLGLEDIYIVGGPSVVGAGVEDSLAGEFDSVERLGGNNRFETSTLFAAAMFAGEDKVTLVRGDNANLADGISAAALGLPIIYARHDSLPMTVEAYLNSVLTGFSRVSIVGGATAVSEALLNHVDAMINAIPPMITHAYIEDEALGIKIYADIDNVNNIVSLGLPPGCQFTDGFTNLSKPIFLNVANSENGQYDIPGQGLRIHPDDDYIELILLIFEDLGSPGVSTEKLLANDGTEITLTNVDEPANTRTYTMNIYLLPG